MDLGEINTTKKITNFPSIFRNPASVCNQTIPTYLKDKIYNNVKYAVKMPQDVLV